MKSIHPDPTVKKNAIKSNQIKTIFKNNQEEK